MQHDFRYGRREGKRLRFRCLNCGAYEGNYDDKKSGTNECPGKCRPFEWSDKNLVTNGKPKA